MTIRATVQILGFLLVLHRITSIDDPLIFCEKLTDFMI